MPPEDEIERRLRGQSAHYQVIDEAQVLMAGPDGEFRPLGFLTEDGLGYGQPEGVDLAANAHDTTHTIERSWTFTPADSIFDTMTRGDFEGVAQRNSYQTRAEPLYFEGARRGVKRSPLLDLIMGAPEHEQAQLLRRLNMRWRDRIDPGIPKHARHVLPGPPEPGHYVYAKTSTGQTIIGSMPAQDPIAHHGDSTSTYEFTIDPQRSKRDPAFNLANP